MRTGQQQCRVPSAAALSRIAHPHRPGCGTGRTSGVSRRGGRSPSSGWRAGMSARVPTCPRRHRAMAESRFTRSPQFHSVSALSFSLAAMQSASMNAPRCAPTITPMTTPNPEGHERSPMHTSRVPRRSAPQRCRPRVAAPVPSAVRLSLTNAFEDQDGPENRRQDRRPSSEWLPY